MNEGNYKKRVPLMKEVLILQYTRQSRVKLKLKQEQPAEALVSKNEQKKKIKFVIVKRLEELS